MRRNFFLFSGLIAGMLFGTGHSIAQTSAWQNPEFTAEGKEPARSLVKSYNSNEGALIQGDESLYIQPLNEGWVHEQSGAQITYKRDFKVPFAWVDRHIMMHLDRVDGAFELFVNDKRVGFTQNTGTPSEFDIAKYTQEGRNSVVVVVHTDHVGARIESYNSSVSGALGDDNFVLSQPKVRVRDFVADTRIDGTNGLFSLGVVMKTQLLNNKEVKVYYDLLSPEGKSVSYGHRNANFNMKGEDTVRFFANIPNVRGWSHESPSLYTLTVKTQYEGRFLEYLSFPVGFRSVEMAENVLLINGSPVELVVADYGGTGSTETMIKELAVLKDQGVNTIKVQNCPLASDFYTICDRYGLYVIDQAAINTSSSGASRTIDGTLSNDPLWEKSFTDRALRMFYNSKNHPSVVAFSVAGKSANGYNLYQSYLALKELERERPVVYLDSDGEWNNDRIALSYDRSRIDASQAASVSVINIKDGLFSVSNNSRLKGLADVVVKYEVRAGKRLAGSGQQVVSIAAGRSMDISVPYSKLKPGTQISVKITVEEPQRPTYYEHKVVKPDTESQKVTFKSMLSGLKYKAEADPIKQLAEQTFTGSL